MLPLTITANLDLDPWVDLVGSVQGTYKLTRIGLLPAGMGSGRTSVAMVAEVNGQTVIVETSWRLFHTAHAALAATPLIAMEKL